MKTHLYLLSLNISGIKNIEKEIRIDFYKKTIDKNFNPDNYRIKAIYGENGSGKTGIVTAVQILREIILNSNYLNESSNQTFLEEIVNKKTHLLHLECEFFRTYSKTMQVYQYSVEVSNKKADRFVLVNEKLSQKIITSKNAKYDLIYECKNGELQYYKGTPSLLEDLKGYTANLLSKSTFASFSLGYFLQLGQKDVERIQLGVPAISVFILGLSMVARLESEDQHLTFLIQASMKDNLIDKEVLKTIYDLIYKDNQENSVTSQRISKTKFKEYKNKIKQMERFLQLFKNDIKSVDIEKQEDKDFYRCRLLINYEGYRVDQEFESTGIKKLIRLFESLQAAANGDIVFIDEMDSNINDIYLCKLIEFMMLYGKGQLCFTTHNTSPMAVLKKGKKSIDFLSNDNRIVPWTTNGNYQPDSLYKQGMIAYLPFNIEAEDFIGVLGE